MTEYNKPLLSDKELVQHMVGKGISFNIVSKDDAVEYLRNNNNYFKVASYRKNFDQRTLNGGKSEYINLDFGQLKDLAIIDMSLRYAMVQLALDIEHYTKLDVLRRIEDNKEDGYTIVEEYKTSLPDESRRHLESDIKRNKDNVFTKDLVQKYEDILPVWVFLELIPFGSLISFYRFCGERFNSSEMKNNFYVLMKCKSIRNASAHSSCIINDLHPHTATNQAKYYINMQLSNIKDISKKSRTLRMSNERMQQIVSLLYMHRKIVTSPGVHSKACKLLNEFKSRMMKHSDYYKACNMIKASFLFLEKVIDNWFSVD